MKNLDRDDFSFALQPWEMRGMRYDPRPDAVCEVRVGAEMRVALLKVQTNALYFRWAHAESRDCDYVVLQTLARTANEALKFKTRPDLLIRRFQKALETQDWAAFHIHDSLGRYDGLFLMLFKWDGTGRVRDWCDDRLGVPFEWTPEFKLSPSTWFDWDFDFEMWSRDCPDHYKQHRALTQNEQWMEGFGKTPVCRRWLKSQPCYYASGSEADLRVLARLVVESEPEIFGTHQSLEVGLLINQPWIGTGVTLSYPDRTHPVFNIPPSQKVRALLDLLLLLHQPVAYKWQKNWYDGEELWRRNWLCWCEMERWSFARPSMHEAMEANLALRAYLLPMLGADDFKSLLSSELHYCKASSDIVLHDVSPQTFLDKAGPLPTFEA